MTKSPPLLTISDTAKRLQLSEKTIRRWIKSGALPAHKLGAQWRIAPADLDAFLIRHRRASSLFGDDPS